MSAGLVIRVDRFGQVQLVPTYTFIPTLPVTPPADDGVYVLPSVTRQGR